MEDRVPYNTTPAAQPLTGKHVMDIPGYGWAADGKHVWFHLTGAADASTTVFVAISVAERWQAVMAAALAGAAKRREQL